MGGRRKEQNVTMSNWNIFDRMMNAMRRFVLPLILMSVLPCANAADDAKSISGISIIGNKEAPKSLFIVPWKSSELGDVNSLTSSLLNEKMVPVDKEVFQRELDFYSATVIE